MLIVIHVLHYCVLILNTRVFSMRLPIDVQLFRQKKLKA